MATIFCIADQIAVPDFSAGAMENWGLISYQESGLLFEEDTSSNFDKEWVATIIAHELAHQVNRFNVSLLHRYGIVI